MAVEIINSVPDKSVAKEIICSSCGVTLRYVPNDINSYMREDYAGGRERVEYIECPNCNTDIITRST